MYLFLPSRLWFSGLLNKNRLYLTSTAIVGGAALISAVSLEAIDRPIDRGFQFVGAKTGKFLRRVFTPSAVDTNQSWDPVINSHIRESLEFLWSYIKKIFEWCWQSLVSSIYWVIQLPKNIDYYWTGFRTSYQTFFRNTKAWEILKREMSWAKTKNIWNFLIDSEQNKTFFNLFRGEQAEKTWETAQLLLGTKTVGGEYFKVSEGVAGVLLAKWITDPAGVTRKYEKLSKLVNELTKKLEISSLSTSQKPGQSSKPKGTYIFNEEALEDFLNVDEGISEAIYNAIWLGQIGATIENDLPPLPEVSLISSAIANLFGSFFSPLKSPIKAS
ncbi:hypothetical protein MHLP_03855 [Candidatus Mycoplasma haematolamae str. Purdue]|uniref:Uncharacterized protein n=1 Tax=Mycoplasma haematolamae (strain Purdue) TaxID=1212765 RepID=I7CGF8_MYCHA|nr:hypothetical protein [Candidatus Mycoplasma haematolamae]AFO52351.1 hypothetical protein MHLP_03855 [Candidatus Mycoplasma haematolamae str. Purdue]